MHPAFTPFAALAFGADNLLALRPFLHFLPAFLGSLWMGYLLGSFPSGYVIGKTQGIDIRQHGSGNIGATNVFRTLGRKWGVLVFALDMAKGILAVRAALWLSPVWALCMNGGAACLSANVGAAAQAEAVDTVHSVVHVTHVSGVVFGILAGAGCFLGHCYPVWLGFKGGKGIAVGAGIVMGLVPLASTLCLALWGVVFKLTRYVSLASVVAAVALPVAVWLMAGRQAGTLLWFTLAISLIAIWRHRSNIQRLLAGTENRFEKKKPAQENDSTTPEK